MISREQAQQKLERYFSRRSYPRVIMSTIVLATGAAGFFASAGLLRLGLHRMWPRYLLAFGAAYLVFLGLVRLWAEMERRWFAPEMQDEPILERFPDSNGDSAKWWDWINVPDFDLDLEGCSAVVLLLAALALLLGALTIITTAPALIAEVFLDAVLMATLYRRMKNAALRHWLGTAVARTWIPMLAAALLCAGAGALVQAVEPEARTFGEAWRYHQNKDQPLPKPER